MNIHEKIKENYVFNTAYSHSSLPLILNGFERRDLAKLFCTIGFNKGVEIGVQRGLFSMTLLSNNPNLFLKCIDPWLPYNEQSNQSEHEINYEHAVGNLSKLNAEIIRKTSNAALSDFEDRSIDFVYIDGNHEFDYCCSDIIFWSRKVKIGGIIACHDYVIGCDVMRAVDAYTYAHHIDPWYITSETKRNPTAFWINI